MNTGQVFLVNLVSFWGWEVQLLGCMFFLRESQMFSEWYVIYLLTGDSGSFVVLLPFSVWLSE